jgi:hypothetical protein
MSVGSTGWSAYAWPVVKTGLMVALFMGLLVGPSADYTWPAAWFVLCSATLCVLLPCFVYIKVRLVSARRLTRPLHS